MMTKKLEILNEGKYIVDVVGSAGSPQVGDLPVILLELEITDSADYTVKKTYIYANAEILSEHDGGYNAAQYREIRGHHTDLLLQLFWRQPQKKIRFEKCG